MPESPQLVRWLPAIVVAILVLGFFLLKRTAFVPEAKARDLLRQGALVVDVRSPDEFSRGHLPKAVNVPLDALSTQAPTRFPDKGQPLLLHCVSGVRSGMGVQQLKALGYTNAFNLGTYGRAEKLVREGS